MVISAFPSIELADEDGLLAIGGDVEVESLLLAYSSGIFPWPIAGELLAWFTPPYRAVLYLDDFHISRSLKKAKKQSGLSFSIDAHFKEVISACSEAKNRNGQHGTWISPELVDAYIDLHKAGYAHSVECLIDGVLVGGLYGVAIGGAFAGESMFHNAPDTSKLALWHLIDYLKDRGVTWIDCQILNPHLESLGAKEIPRDEFLAIHREAIDRDIKLF